LYLDIDTYSSALIDLDSNQIASDARKIHSSSSSSCRRGRLEPAEAAIPIPLASKTCLATTLAAPSDDFFGCARVLRRAPKACALMTATVQEIGVDPGDGERE